MNAELSGIIVQIVKEKKPQTVFELTSLVKEKAEISEEEVLKCILKLQSEGKIKLEKPLRYPSSLVAYLKSEQAAWYWVTIAISVVTTAVVFTIPEDLYPWVYLRYALGAIFVLWLPGYTFIKALFPFKTQRNASEKNLDYIERIGLSLGMSLALVPIIGLLLNYTPWGIRLTPIVLSLLALTIIFATTAIVREYQFKSKKKEHSYSRGMS